jgi:biotin operon repressor
MMVYLVLRDSGVPLSQQVILDAIFERFGVKIQRQTVGRHVKLLQEMGCSITYDRQNGYKMN